MKSTHHVQQRPQDQGEGLRAFGNSAFCRTTEKTRSAGHGTTAAPIRHLGRRANIHSRVQRVRDQGDTYMNSVEDLDVFKLAHQLALKAYAATRTFPREELLGLGSQIRRAAASVGMNLMEGAMRLGGKEYRQFVGIARGSAGEVCYQLLLARDLKYISNESYQELRSGYDRVIQMLSRLSQSLADEPRPRSR